MSYERTLYQIILATALLSLVIVSTSSWNFISADVERLRAKLDGDHEVPPVNSTATAVAKFKVKNDTITYNINVTGLSDATGAQIHLGGKKDRTGDILVDLLKAGKLSETPAGMIIQGNFTGSNLEGPMAGNTTSALVSNANHTYIEIQTKAHPDGEIRGQIKQVLPKNSSQSVVP